MRTRAKRAHWHSLCRPPDAGAATVGEFLPWESAGVANQGWGCKPGDPVVKDLPAQHWGQAQSYAYRQWGWWGGAETGQPCVGSCFVMVALVVLPQQTSGLEFGLEWTESSSSTRRKQTKTVPKERCLPPGAHIIPTGCSSTAVSNTQVPSPRAVNQTRGPDRGNGCAQTLGAGITSTRYERAALQGQANPDRSAGG